jgi:hypothetical protein
MSSSRASTPGHTIVICTKSHYPDAMPRATPVGGSPSQWHDEASKRRICTAPGRLVKPSDKQLRRATSTYWTPRRATVAKKTALGRATEAKKTTTTAPRTLVNSYVL